MTQPIFADFNNRDKDDAIRMSLPFKTMNLEKIELKPIEGMAMWISDGEIEASGVLTLRDKIWVVIPNKEGFKNVDPKSPYYTSNI